MVSPPFFASAVLWSPAEAELGPVDFPVSAACAPAPAKGNANKAARSIERETEIIAVSFPNLAAGLHSVRRRVANAASLLSLWISQCSTRRVDVPAAIIVHPGRPLMLKNQLQRGRGEPGPGPRLPRLRGACERHPFCPLDAGLHARRNVLGPDTLRSCRQSRNVPSEPHCPGQTEESLALFALASENLGGAVAEKLRSRTIRELVTSIRWPQQSDSNQVAATPSTRG